MTRKFCLIWIITAAASFLACKLTAEPPVPLKPEYEKEAVSSLPRFGEGKTKLLLPTTVQIRLKDLPTTIPVPCPMPAMPPVMTINNSLRESWLI